MFTRLLCNALSFLTGGRLLRTPQPTFGHHTNTQKLLPTSIASASPTLSIACSETRTTTATVLSVNDELKRLIERLEVFAEVVPYTANPTGTLTVQQRDNTIYNASAVAQCWSNNQDCQFTYQSVSTCYNSFGPLTDPNDNQQSVNYQGCLCGNMQWNAGLEQDTPFFHCMTCMRSAGVYGPLLDTTNANFNDFCATQDPNVFLWLNQFVNFTLAIKPGVDGLWVSYTIPLSGPITAISSLAPDYRLDTGANVPPPTPTDTRNLTLFLASGATPPPGLSTEFSVIQTTVIVDPDTTVTEEFTRTPTAPQIITFATTVQAITSSTLATHSGGQAIVLITPLQGVSTVVTTTATFGWPLGNVTMEPQTLTVQRVKNQAPGRNWIWGFDLRGLKVRLGNVVMRKEEPTDPFGTPVPVVGGGGGNGDGNGRGELGLKGALFYGFTAGFLWWLVLG